MSKSKRWIVTVGENTHEITFIPNSFSGKHKLIVDGKSTSLPTSFKTNFIGLDHIFYVEKKRLHIVLQGSKIDIAIDDVFVDSKLPYTPLKPMPAFGWFFIVSCIAIPFITLGGALPAALGFGGATIVSRIAIEPKWSLLTRFFLCLVISLACWACLYFLILGMIQ